MVMIVDTPALATLLQRVGVETFLAELADRIEADFAHWPQFEQSARLAVHFAGGVVELMPTADAEGFSLKPVNGHPGNPATGLLTVTAVGMLVDVATGYPRRIPEMTVLTALRTAATSALAARRLANPGARTMALIGTGAQGEFQALAFKACLGIRRIPYFDTDVGAVPKFAANLANSGLELVACGSVAEAVSGAGVITTATAVKAAQRLLTDARVGPGVHINAVGGDCPGKTEVDAKRLARVRVFVEYLPPTLIEGDIQALGAAARATELWQVVTSRAPGRTDRSEVTIFDSVGFAIEDYSARRYVYDQARARGLGRESRLVPEPRDPKDLYGHVRELAA